MPLIDYRLRTGGNDRERGRLSLHHAQVARLLDYGRRADRRGDVDWNRCQIQEIAVGRAHNGGIIAGVAQRRRKIQRSRAVAVVEEGGEGRQPRCRQNDGLAFGIAGRHGYGERLLFGHALRRDRREHRRQILECRSNDEGRVDDGAGPDVERQFGGDRVRAVGKPIRIEGRGSIGRTADEIVGSQALGVDRAANPVRIVQPELDAVDAGACYAVIGAGEDVDVARDGGPIQNNGLDRSSERLIRSWKDCACAEATNGMKKMAKKQTAARNGAVP